MTKVLKGSNTIKGVNNVNSGINIDMPNVSVPKRITNITNKIKGNSVGDVMKITKAIDREMQRALSNASNYLKDRENKYNREIRHIQGVLKRTKNIGKIKAYNKRLKELNKRVDKIQNTRTKREEETRIKWEKIKTKVQIDRSLKNEKNTDKASLSNLLDKIEQLDAQLTGVKNSKTHAMVIKAINYLYETYYQPDLDPTATKLYKICMSVADDSKLETEEDELNLYDELINACENIYKEYFVDHGLNTERQFIVAVVINGFKGEAIKHVI